MKQIDFMELLHTCRAKHTFFKPDSTLNTRYRTGMKFF